MHTQALMQLVDTEMHMSTRLTCLPRVASTKSYTCGTLSLPSLSSLKCRTALSCPLCWFYPAARHGRISENLEAELRVDTLLHSPVLLLDAALQELLVRLSSALTVTC